TDEIPAAQLAKALASDPLTDAGRTIDDIVVTRRDVTGRAEIISIEGERRRQIRGWDFKLIVGRALGWNILKSSRFSVRRSGSMFIFRGTGFGHGLGLCQNGSHVMARRGGKFEQILDKYFPGARLSVGHPRSKQESRTAATLKSEKRSRNSTVFETENNLTSFALLQPCALQLSPRQSLSSEPFHV